VADAIDLRRHRRAVSGRCRTAVLEIGVEGNKMGTASPRKFPVANRILPASTPIGCPHLVDSQPSISTIFCRIRAVSSAR
jgi:hypothetical protein